MTFTDLPTDQQKLVTQLDSILTRSALRVSRSSLAKMRATVEQYDAVTKLVTDTLSDGDLIPYTGGLDGAVPVTKLQLATMIEAFRALLSVWDIAEVRLAHAAFVGAVNLDG